MQRCSKLRPLSHASTWCFCSAIHASGSDLKIVTLFEGFFASTSSWLCLDTCGLGCTKHNHRIWCKIRWLCSIIYRSVASNVSTSIQQRNLKGEFCSVKAVFPPIFLQYSLLFLNSVSTSPIWSLSQCVLVEWCCWWMASSNLFLICTIICFNFTENLFPRCFSWT